MISLLVLCYPTYSRSLHLDAKGTSVVLAPDEMLLILTQMGVRVEVVNLSPFSTSLPLMRSRLAMKALPDVEPHQFDVCWHMFRDPTPPEVLQQADGFIHWFPRKRVVNHATDLSRFYKRFYLPILERLGIGPQVLDIDPSTLQWLSADHSAAVSTCHRFVRTPDCNNNRGDYPDREARGPVVAAFLDSSCAGQRSFFRVGYAADKVLPGWMFTTSDDKLILKSGTCRRREQHAVRGDEHAQIIEAMRTMGIDVAHIEGTYVNGVPMIFDVNPYPTSYGATLSGISRTICEALIEHWRAL